VTSQSRDVNKHGSGVKMAVGGKQSGLYNITNVKVRLAQIFKIAADGNSNLKLGFNLKLARW